jgi:limonene-1,2-epoxide hydrolase
VRRLALVGVALALAAAGTAQAAATPAQVVRAWSKALNANNNTAAAKLFAPNARVVQPGLDARLSTRAVAIAFNDALALRREDRRTHGEGRSRDSDVRRPG